MLQIHDSYFLVAIIDNDYISSNLFDTFDALVEKKMQAKPDTPFAVDNPLQIE